MSTPSRSATERASPTGRTLKPMMIASDAAASMTSDSLMPPTPERMTLTATSSWGSLAISSCSASAEPATSALTSRLSSFSSPAWMSLKMSSSERLRPERRACCSCLRRCSRSCASWRARRSFSTTRTYSPASGTPSKPSASTGSPGRAFLRRSPVKSCIARTRPQWAPATSASPTCSVPRWMRIVTTGPRPGSSLDSTTTPDAAALGFALRSSSSATTCSVSSRSSRPTFGFALDDLGRPDRVQQRRLAVVDVAHDRHDRRTVGEILVGVLEDGLALDLVGGVDDLDLLAELLGQDADGVVGQRLRERRHLAEHHELLDDLRDRHAHRLGDVLDGRAGVDTDEVGVRDGGLVQRRDRVVVRAAA